MRHVVDFYHSVDAPRRPCIMDIPERGEGKTRRYNDAEK
jgi:hypothetical protein